MQRKINDKGLILIRSFEGCKLKAYADPASRLGTELRKPLNARQSGWEQFSGGPWTVGWGSTGIDPFHTGPDGKPLAIGPDTVWTQQQADQRQTEHLLETCESVAKLLKREVTDDQFAALVSFTYNCGVGSLKSSTLLQKLNRGDLLGAAEEFLKWNKAQGQVMAGLARRREAERRLFLSPI